MKQADLFDMPPPAPRYPNGPGWTEPTTSKAAAEAIRPHMTDQQKRIVAYLKFCGSKGATYNEIAAGTGLYPQSVCGRMVELVEAGAVTIAKITRPTQSGRQAKVYLAAADQ